MADAAQDPSPPAIPTAERMASALGPFRDLIAYVDAMGALGSVEQAAREGEGRIAAAQRDLQTTLAQIDAEKAALADANAELERKRAEVEAYDAQTKDGANAQAASVLEKAKADADALVKTATDKIAALANDKARAEADLADVNGKVAEAQTVLASLNDQIDALKAKFA